MKIRSWLSTCSSTSSTALSPPPKSLTSDNSSSSSSDFQTNSSNSNSSLQSNLSLLTLPSLPSLQKLTLSPQTPISAVLLTSLTHHRLGHIHFLALHNNLLYAASGNEINVFDTITNTLFDTFNTNISHTGSVKSIAFLNGKIFTAHQDCKIRVWTLNDHNRSPSLVKGMNGVTSYEYEIKPNNKQHTLVATLPTLEDRLTRFLFPRNYVNIRRHKKKLWIHHNDAVSGLTSSENDTLVLSVSWDRSIKIWNSHDFRCRQSITKAHDDAINAVTISNDGLIYTGSADKRIKVWKKEDKKYGLIATLEKHKSAVNALALNQNGSVLFSGSCDRSILVWEREDSANHMAVVGALRGHAKAILCLINVQDLLLSGSADRTVRIWQRGLDGRYCCLTVLDGHRTPVRSLAVAEMTADGGGVRVFSGSFDGEIRVWQVEVSRAMTTFDKTINFLNL